MSEFIDSTGAVGKETQRQHLYHFYFLHEFACSLLKDQLPGGVVSLVKIPVSGRWASRSSSCPVNLETLRPQPCWWDPSMFTVCSSTGSEPPPISTVGSPTGCQALSWQGAEVNGVGVPPWIVCRLQGEVRETRQDSWVIPTKG